MNKNLIKVLLLALIGAGIADKDPGTISVADLPAESLTDTTTIKEDTLSEEETLTEQQKLFKELSKIHHSIKPVIKAAKANDEKILPFVQQLYPTPAQAEKFIDAMKAFAASLDYSLDTKDFWYAFYAKDNLINKQIEKIEKSLTAENVTTYQAVADAINAIAYAGEYYDSSIFKGEKLEMFYPSSSKELIHETAQKVKAILEFNTDVKNMLDSKKHMKAFVDKFLTSPNSFTEEDKKSLKSNMKNYFLFSQISDILNQVNFEQSDDSMFDQMKEMIQTVQSKTKENKTLKDFIGMFNVILGSCWYIDSNGEYNKDFTDMQETEKAKTAQLVEAYRKEEVQNAYRQQLDQFIAQQFSGKKTPTENNSSEEIAVVPGSDASKSDDQGVKA